MKETNQRAVGEGQLITLGHILERLAANPTLSPTRLRDLRSSITTYAKLIDREPGSIPLDFRDIRRTFDSIVPAAANVSRKRWSNLRSDLVAAIEASGLRPVLRTAWVKLDPAWKELYRAVADRRVRKGLSRFAHWASLRQIAPQDVNERVIERFIAELDTLTLVRHFSQQHRGVVKVWNILVGLRPDMNLQAIVRLPSRDAPKRIPWERLPASFRIDVDQHSEWSAMTDPLEDGSRVRALSPRTRLLQRELIHSAATDAVAAGVDIGTLTSLASLVEVNTFKALLLHRWRASDRKLSAYADRVAHALITIAAEWVQAPPDQIVALKRLRSKLGTVPPGLTEKNRTFLRKFDDPRLLRQLLELPDRLGRDAQRNLAKRPSRSFLDLQTALAIDILLHAPLRMQNLVSLSFDKHLHWPQGVGKPACAVFPAGETKNRQVLEFELPEAIGKRLLVFRNEIAPAVVGSRPDLVFVYPTGKPRKQSVLASNISKVIARHLGIRCTPHQFRHLCAKVILTANPAALEQVRQLLGHKTVQTTLKFYAQINTLAAGRAHAELLMQLREQSVGERRRPRR